MKSFMVSVLLFIQMACFGQCKIDAKTTNKFVEAFNGKLSYQLSKCNFSYCGWNQIETFNFSKQSFSEELQDEVFYEFAYSSDFKEKILMKSLLSRKMDSISATKLTNYIICKFSARYYDDIKKCREATAKYYGINFESHIFDFVEESPSFAGGELEMDKFIHEKLVYPEGAKKEKIEGEICIKFIVDKEGNLSDFKVINGLGYGMDEEAVRILKLMPKWIPGVHIGMKVNVRYSVGIVFKIP